MDQRKGFDMDIALFDFILPENLIAQSPAKKRDQSRLLVVNKDERTLEDKVFSDIIDYLHEGDVLVRNNTKVIPARLFGVKDITKAHIELLLLKQTGDDIWECLVGNAKTVKIGTRVSFGEGKLIAECLESFDEGIKRFKMHYQGIFFEVLDELGKMPLPPYIKTQYGDNSRYQTVYAKVEGSSAAPTAGFHFTDELIMKVKQKGVTIVDVTLHIGLGTFRPVKVEDIKKHHMHSEVYVMEQEAADVLNIAQQENRRIIAVGTTSVRVLETVKQKYGKFVACSGETDIFIYPGYTFVAVKALITNFHLPKSTLIMLVSAFADREFILKSYQHAIDEEYRFFSFGDAMFIYGSKD